MDSVGFPELPAVVCFVAVPDDADLDVSYSQTAWRPSPWGFRSIPLLWTAWWRTALTHPVIRSISVRTRVPTPRKSGIRRSWRRFVGEFHLRDQRVAIVAVHPVQYLASGDSLRVWGDLEMSVLLDGEELDWNEDGLGYYDLLVGDMLLGYHPDYEPIETQPQPQVVRHEVTTSEPPIDPDYVILVADGLDGDWIDSFADYRADLNGFDVLIANLGGHHDRVRRQLHLIPTPDIIRDYMEALWDWSSGRRATHVPAADRGP